MFVVNSHSRSTVTSGFGAIRDPTATLLTSVPAVIQTSFLLRELEKMLKVCHVLLRLSQLSFQFNVVVLLVAIVWTASARKYLTYAGFFVNIGTQK